MIKSRVYSHYTIQTATLLGKQIRLRRKQRKWTESELAQRAGVVRATIQKIEKGDVNCAIGLVFEVATLVGVKLFAEDSHVLTDIINRTDDKIALLPKSIHNHKKEVDDDF